MGCGCKNKGNQAPQQGGAQPQPQPQGGQPQNQTIQESIKKVVEKYYTKR
jgi:hypothetical protein